MECFQTLLGFVSWFTFFTLASSYNVHVTYDDLKVVPILTCENANQIYAVACTATGSGGKFSPPIWVGWRNDGTEIDINENTRKYSKATDGNQLFYLLITGTEMELTNTGEKYACYSPRSTLEPDQLRLLPAAVLKVLPSDQCEDASDETSDGTSDGTSSTLPSTTDYSTRRLTTPAATPHQEGIKDGRSMDDNDNTGKADGSSHVNCSYTGLPAVWVVGIMILVLTVVNFVMLAIHARKRCWNKKADRCPPTEDV